MTRTGSRLEMVDYVYRSRRSFCWSTWAVVCMFAFGGLLVAVVIRFADNNLKNLAMALAIILSCLVSVPLFDFKPNGAFAGGGLGCQA